MTRATKKSRMDRKIVELLQSGLSLNEVTRRLKVGDRRVRRLRVLAEQQGYLGIENPKPLPPHPEAIFPEVANEASDSVRPASEADELLLSKKEWIEERLKARWHPITVFEELGLAVGRSSFYRFLERHGLDRLAAENNREANRVIPEIVHEPGEALLLDWGKLRDVTDPETGKSKPLWAFVGILGFSRYLTVKLVWSNDVSTTTGAIQEMLREIGGVPARITSDNPKCFALEASRFEPLLNPAFERLGSHYGFRPECLPPAKPQTKGKVERPMPYIRRLYEAHGSEWLGLAESQEYLDRKLALANERKHGTTRRKPIELLLEVEAAKLKPLPALAYEPETFSEGMVRRDGHVRFENKYYSLPESLIGETVTILGDRRRVSIYHRGKLIETHARVTDPHRSKSTKAAHLKPWERALQDESLYRTRARKLGPDVERLIELILGQGLGFIDTRKIWGILALDKTYATEQINQACRTAIDLQTPTYRVVSSLLKLSPKRSAVPGRESENPSEVRVAREKTTPSTDAPKNHQFVRSMAVYEEQLAHSWSERSDRQTTLLH